MIDGIAMTLGVMLAATLAQAEFSAKVVGIADAKTAKALDSTSSQRRIRLAARDNPKRGQPWGTCSRRALAEPLGGEDAVIEDRKADLWERTIAVALGSAARPPDVALSELTCRIGWHFTRSAHVQPEEKGGGRSISEGGNRPIRLSVVSLVERTAPSLRWLVDVARRCAKITFGGQQCLTKFSGVR